MSIRFPHAHSRRARQEWSPYTDDNLIYVVPHDEIRRAAFEDAYGHPTDIDRVWADRAAKQNGVAL